MLTHIIAARTGLKAKEFVHIIGNAHIYDDHIEPLTEQINRVIPDNTMANYPTFVVVNNRENLEYHKITDKQ